MKKILILALLFLSTACYSQISVTTIIVPFPPGGSYDILGRKFAQFAQIKTGRPFVVENISGAGGNIGVSKFLNSRPNTLLITSSSLYLAINNKEFNLEDFRPIAILAEAPFFLAVNKLQQFTCEKLKYSTDHYFLGSAALMTEVIAKIISSKYPNIENIPYKAVKQSTVDLIGGRINGAITTSTNDIIDPLIPLANSSNRTVNGVPSFNDCLGIANTPQGDFVLITNTTSDDAFIKDTNTLALEFLKDRDIQAYYQENSMSSDSTKLKDVRSTVKSHLDVWKRVIK